MENFKAMSSNKLQLKVPTRVQPEVMPKPNQTGNYTNKIHYLRKYLLDELATKKFAVDFMEPVDTVALKVPNYYAVIRHPMDVGTIVKRVQNAYYPNVNSMIKDFDLIISNCYEFNPPDGAVYRNCKKMQNFYNRVLAKMPKGEEKLSTKDPLSSGRYDQQQLEGVQRQCKGQLILLNEAIAREKDNSLFKYFQPKFDSLTLKVDRHYFKTRDDFQFEVIGIFKSFANKLNMLQKRIHTTCEHSSQRPYTGCLQCDNPNDEAVTNLQLDKQTINDVVNALKNAYSGIESCKKSFTAEKDTRAKSLIDAFEATAKILKQKLTNSPKHENTVQIQLHQDLPAHTIKRDNRSGERSRKVTILKEPASKVKYVVNKPKFRLPHTPSTMSVPQGPARPYIYNNVTAHSNGQQELPRPDKGPTKNIHSVESTLLLDLELSTTDDSD